MRHSHFRTCRPKSLPNTMSIAYLVSSEAAGEGKNPHGESWQKSWQKKLVFMYLPKRLNKHLIGRDIINVGLVKSHLSIWKPSTLEKYMQWFICISLLSFGGHICIRMSFHSIHLLVALLGSLDFEMNATTTTASITISKAVRLRQWSRVLSELEVPIIFFGWYREAWGSGIRLFRTGVRTGGCAQFSGLVGV
jgi:hypothetical protein